MKRVPVEKKRKARWPWAIGAAALAVIVWGATTLLAPPPEPAPPVVSETAADTLPPSSIPMPPGTDPSGPPSIYTVTPLTADDVGQPVRVRGEVVATGTARFWVAFGTEVLRIDSEREARKGDTISVAGTLEAADPEATDVIASEVLSRSPAFEDWSIVREVKLVEARPATGEADPAADSVAADSAPPGPVGEGPG